MMRQCLSAVSYTHLTDTCDCTGTVTAEAPVSFTREEFLKALEFFKGDSMQVPPIYSALKINGRKLYDYARAGEKAVSYTHLDVYKRQVYG